LSDDEKNKKEIEISTLEAENLGNELNSEILPNQNGEQLNKKISKKNEKKVKSNHKNKKISKKLNFMIKTDRKVNQDEDCDFFSAVQLKEDSSIMPVIQEKNVSKYPPETLPEDLLLPTTHFSRKDCVDYYRNKFGIMEGKSIIPDNNFSGGRQVGFYCSGCDNFHIKFTNSFMNLFKIRKNYVYIFLEILQLILMILNYWFNIYFICLFFYHFFEQ
jgi:hypothetical protein